MAAKSNDQHDEVLELASAKAKQLEDLTWDVNFKSTNIDRRKCERVRPMEVLCLGLHRTGTLSLRAALLHLGYYDVYHMASPLIENHPDGAMWSDAIAAKRYGKGKFDRNDWDKLLGHCMAVTDQPCAAFAPELMAAYPEAKVILTVRDKPEAWAMSVINTISRLVDVIMPYHVRHPGWNPLNHLQRFLIPRPPFFHFFEGICDMVPCEKCVVEESGVQFYHEHNDLVRKLAPKGKFLEFNVKQGWGPLCEFLEKPMPDMPFPNINDSSTYGEKTKKLRDDFRIGYCINAFLWIGLPAAVFTLTYLYREAWPVMLRFK